MKEISHIMTSQTWGGANLIMFCWFERHSTALIDEGHLAHHDFSDAGFLSSSPDTSDCTVK